ncbi:5-(carboxyamino)imidazole ribonucleotide mutase [Candidatus Aerophobetes bacterium]|uniref:Phosphoribosylaminoimidazole carboxylase n=1 Tax=Aerophobetes bacterium TaxID=2030807 RepID=A0A497E5S1_UNCAE|nr:MAG: 5-(carboxyamino)imidazole ribonucleotide mutase [Candidatus Aerophobetes bacterium]
MGKVVVVMGSRKDVEHCRRISSVLERFGVECVLRIASAHKTPLKVLDIIKEYEIEEVVFITVAGKSNALSGFVDANTTRPVIACPPYGDRFTEADIFSGLRMPSGVCPLMVLEPEQAALAALKILGLSSERLRKEVEKYQQKDKRQVERDDRQIRER